MAKQYPHAIKYYNIPFWSKPLTEIESREAIATFPYNFHPRITTAYITTLILSDLSFRTGGPPGFKS